MQHRCSNKNKLKKPFKFERSPTSNIDYPNRLKCNNLKKKIDVCDKSLNECAYTWCVFTLKVKWKKKQ